MYSKFAQQKIAGRLNKTDTFICVCGMSKTRHSKLTVVVVTGSFVESTLMTVDSSTTYIYIDSVKKK